MGLTLDEAIKHCEEVAEQNEKICNEELRVGLPDIYLHKDRAKQCAEEHRQLAEWLKELRAFREKAPKGDRKVTCASCVHLDARDMQGQAAPVCFCRAKIWEDRHVAPHKIEHDPYLPILCSYWWKVKEESEEE